jgi:hypothetical protein
MQHISHGPFLVDQAGGLTPAGDPLPALRFAWRGRGCEARIEAGRISLTAQAGRIPFTAEGRAARPGVFALLGEMPAALPQGWQLRLLPDHRVHLAVERSIPEVATATQLVGAMVSFALALDPYLDRLESAGLSGAAGTVKI